MSVFQDLRTSTWAFLEAYGWITVFVTILAYVIYKKYIYDLFRNMAEQKRLVEQKKFDREVQEKEGQKMRMARKRQQEEHDKQEKVEKQKREEKEKELAEKRLKELDEQEKTFQTLGRSKIDNTTSSSEHSLENSPLQLATNIVDSVSGSGNIAIFGHSTCPNFRKVCQLVSTYRLDSAQFHVYEFDKQPVSISDAVLKFLESRYETKLSPFVFVHGKFIGGLEDARNYEKKYGFNEFASSSVD